MGIWSLITIIFFVAFVAICALLLLPNSDKGEPYKDAAKLALKEDGDAPITPRTRSSDKRTKS